MAYELKSKNESNFEFALRLTQALKEAENSGIIQAHPDGTNTVYLDSKTVLDVIYEATTAKEWVDEPLPFTDDLQTEFATAIHNYERPLRASVAEREYPSRLTQYTPSDEGEPTDIEIPKPTPPVVQCTQCGLPIYFVPIHELNENEPAHEKGRWNDFNPRGLDLTWICLGNVGIYHQAPTIIDLTQ